MSRRKIVILMLFPFVAGCLPGTQVTPSPHDFLSALRHSQSDKAVEYVYAVDCEPGKIGARIVHTCTGFARTLGFSRVLSGEKIGFVYGVSCIRMTLGWAASRDTPDVEPVSSGVWAIIGKPAFLGKGTRFGQTDFEQDPPFWGGNVVWQASNFGLGPSAFHVLANGRELTDEEIISNIESYGDRRGSGAITDEQAVAQQCKVTAQNG